MTHPAPSLHHPKHPRRDQVLKSSTPQLCKGAHTRKALGANLPWGEAANAWVPTGPAPREDLQGGKGLHHPHMSQPSPGHVLVGMRGQVVPAGLSSQSPVTSGGLITQMDFLGFN